MDEEPCYAGCSGHLGPMPEKRTGHAAGQAGGGLCGPACAKGEERTRDQRRPEAPGIQCLPDEEAHHFHNGHEPQRQRDHGQNQDRGLRGLRMPLLPRGQSGPCASFPRSGRTISCFSSKQFPVKSHLRGVPLSLAALAADRQGKFWEFHDAMYTTLKFEDADIQALAKTLGLDLERFNKDLADPALLERIRTEKREGLDMGLQGTPGIFINGKFYQGIKTYEELKGLPVGRKGHPCMASSKGAVFALVGLLVFFLGSTRAVAEDVSVCRLGTARILLLERSGQADEALAEAERVTQQDGFCRSAWMRQAVLLSARKDWRGTEKALQRALRLGEDNTLRLRLAEVFLAQEKAIWARRTLDGLVDPLTGEEQGPQELPFGPGRHPTKRSRRGLGTSYGRCGRNNAKTLPLYDYPISVVFSGKTAKRPGSPAQPGAFSRPTEPRRRLASCGRSGTGTDLRARSRTGMDLECHRKPLVRFQRHSGTRTGRTPTGGKGPDAFGLGLRGQAGWFPLHLTASSLGVAGGGFPACFTLKTLPTISP